MRIFWKGPAAALLSAALPFVPNVGSLLTASPPPQLSVAITSPAPDHRPLTPAGTLYETRGQFPAGAALDAATGQVVVSDANKTLDLIESFDAATPALSSATVPTSSVNPLPGEGPDSQSGHLFVTPDGTVYAAGGSTGTVRTFSDAVTPVQTATYQVGAVNPLTGPGDRSGYVGDVAVLADGHTLIASEPFDAGGGKGDKVVSYDTATAAQHSATVGIHPLALAISPALTGPQVVAVANQGDGTISILDPATMKVREIVATGREPDAMSFTPDGSQLLVVDSLDDSLAVVDTADWRVAQRVSVSSANGLGAEPSALALSSDGATAYLALSADNAVAVVRRDDRGGWVPAGLIPTARYPTGVVVDDAAGELLVTDGKAGAATVADMPDNLGALEQIPMPDAETLAADTARVVANNEVAPPSCSTSALAAIKHVVYVIRENKTYDTEFGDEPGGLAAYTMYGRRITPNAHALAQRFALLEDFTSDEEVSDTGHQTVMGGVANDWVQRFAEQAYNIGGAERPGAELGNDDSVLWSPNNYLLDSALAAGISFRDYGEFYRRDQATDAAISPALDSHIVHAFPGFGFDPGTPDTKRIAFWRQQFAADVAHQDFPALEVIYLPEDHTSSGLSADPSSQQQVADADLALGQLVGTLSSSPYWRSTAVFMTEDDPQDGMDHIDVHRTLGLVMGGHVREGVQTAVPYDQLSMLRTIEEILGLPPLTEHDATARPMTSLFEPAHVNTTPYTPLAPSPPPVTPATAREMRTLARRWFGAAATPASIVDRFGNDSFRLQWLSTHGRPFVASAALPGPGVAAEVRPSARGGLLARGAAQAAATPDCTPARS